MFQEKRDFNLKTGKYGEDLAVAYLINKKYKIIERNIKLSYREVDIIANIKDITVFVEVKTRTSGIFGGAISAINSKKIKLLKKAMVSYSIEKYISLNQTRLDFIAIDIDKKSKKINIQHFKDII